MIYATHRLYDSKHHVTTYRVVETKDGCVSCIYNYECEKHSMQWYDAIVLSSNIYKEKFFDTITETLKYITKNNNESNLYAYGVKYDTDGYSITKLE